VGESGRGAALMEEPGRGGVVDRELLEASLAAVVELARQGLRGARGAKVATLQSFAQHSLAVANAAARIAYLLALHGARVVPERCAELLGDGPDYAKLCGFLAGLVHDYYKAYTAGDRERLRELVAAVLDSAGEVLEQQEVDALLDVLLGVAEAVEAGPTSRALAAGALPLSQAAALADLLASQPSLSAAEAALRSPDERYRAPVEVLGEKGLVFKTLRATRQSLVLTEAGFELAEEAARRGCVPLLVYHDGSLFLCPRGAGVEYSKAVDIVYQKLAGLMGVGGGAAFDEQARRALEKSIAKAAQFGANVYNRGKTPREELREALQRLRERCKDAYVDAAAATAAAVARGAVSADEAARMLEEARRDCRGVQIKTLLGGGVKRGEELVKVHGSAIAAYVRELVEEGRLGEAAGVVAAVAGYWDGGCCAPGLGEALPEARMLSRYKPVVAVPVLTGLLLAGGRDRLLSVVDAVTGSGEKERALRRFVEAYVATGLGGSLLRGAKPGPGDGEEPAAYCTVCRAPIPDLSVAVEFSEYGKRIGLVKGLAELWLSDDAPGASTETRQAQSRYGGAARRICPACLYEAARLSRGVGAGRYTGKRGASPLLLVYAVHPVASPEQLALAALAVAEGLGAHGGVCGRAYSSPEEVLSAVAAGVEDALSASKTIMDYLRSLLIDFLAARSLHSLSIIAERMACRLQRDDRTSTQPTMDAVAAGLAAAGAVLPLLGGQVILSHGLAHPRPASKPVAAGRPILLVEEAEKLLEHQRGGSYLAAVAAALSFTQRAAGLVAARNRVDRCRGEAPSRCAAEYLIQLEQLAFAPAAALTTPPRPGLHPETNLGLEGLVSYLSRVLGGVPEVAVLTHLRSYAYAMCCATLSRELSRHAVQGPLREALSFIIDYMDVVSDKDDLVEAAARRGVEAARRRAQRLSPQLEKALRDSIRAVAEWFYEKTRELQPSKARQLMEALLDTAYDLARECRYTKNRAREVCPSLGVSSQEASPAGEAQA